jgi:polyferredoxin
MEKMGYPAGLVRYTTQNAVSGKPTRVFRPRIAVYAFLLVGVTGAVVYGLTQRVPLELDIIRDRNALYRETSHGMVENVYTLKVINMDGQPHRYRLSVAGILGMELFGAEQPVPVNAGEVVSFPVRVRVDPFALERGSTAITFTLEAEGNPRLKTIEEARFLGPMSRG